MPSPSASGRWVDRLHSPRGYAMLLVWGYLAVQLGLATPRLVVPCVDQVHEGRRYTATLSRMALIPYLGLIPTLGDEPYTLVIRDAETGEILEIDHPDLCKDVFRDHPFLRGGPAR